MFDFNFELSVQGVDPTTCDQEQVDMEERKSSFANETTNKSSFSSVSSEKSPKLADNYEPIDIEGQKETGIWVHQPGSEVSQTWKPRKGKSRRFDTEICREPNDLVGNNCNSSVSGSLNNDSSSPDDIAEDKHRMKSVRRGLHKIGLAFRRSQKGIDDKSCSVEEVYPSPRDNIRSINSKGIGVKFVMEDSISGFPTGKVQAEGGSPEGSGPDSPAKGNVKDMAKNILKHAEKSARGLKHVLSCKSRKYKGDHSPAGVPERVIESESSGDDDDDESLSVKSPIDERYPVVYHQVNETMVSRNNGSPNSRENVVQSLQTVVVPSNTTVENESLVKNNEPESEKACSPDRTSEEFVVKSAEPEHDKEEMMAVAADKRDV